MEEDKIDIKVTQDADGIIISIGKVKRKITVSQNCDLVDKLRKANDRSISMFLRRRHSIEENM